MATLLDVGDAPRFLHHSNTTEPLAIGFAKYIYLLEHNPGFIAAFVLLFVVVFLLVVFWGRMKQRYYALEIWWWEYKQRKYQGWRSKSSMAASGGGSASSNPLHDEGGLQTNNRL